ncbi:uncharacterized protein LOC114312452 [Camellia sinensis]|uniref:uncharacterized protein LOC114312452 n=1 Tax=Camellia sinensis TaxID=4442 RepID=UPI001036C541|nr:uncharacterized protein LOC114312452 [Camellia sinensis]
MKGEIVQMIHEFYANAKLSSGVNSSFIMLVPKKDNPIGLGDYRPISLVSSICKILAKVLSRRLKQVLPEVISEVQSAFVCGRHILDGVLIANEVIHEWHSAKKKAEGLNLLLKRAIEVGLIKGATIGLDHLGISHLQFADDTIIFCKGAKEEVLNIKRVLRCFEVMSGLKINFHKSFVYGGWV